MRKPETGLVVAGRFRLERELGRGGMGTVWVAHHIVLDAPCAVKFMETASNELARERFQREARAAARLRGSHVVQILDYGVWEETPYIAMELLRGEDLRQRLRRQCEGNGQCGALTRSRIRRRQYARLNDQPVLH